MAAIDFPASPTVGQAFTAGNGVVYTWSGTLWLASGASAGGDFCAILGGPVGLPTTTSVATTMPVVNGNSGGWYTSGNGQYRPPAGRFLIYAHMFAGGAAGASLIAIGIQKNGVTLQSTQATAQGSSYAPMTIEVNADANGSDVFTMTVFSNSINNSGFQITFGASPISGIKGPPGDPPTAGGGIVSEVLLSAPAASISLFNLPVKTVDLSFCLVPSSPPQPCGLRVANGSTVTVSATYVTQRHYGANVATGADLQSAKTQYMISTSAGASGLFGKIHFPSANLGVFGHFGVGQVFDYNGSVILNLGMSGTSGNGFQFTFDVGNIAAGSYVRAIGWP